jgi:hypothetical protein
MARRAWRGPREVLTDPNLDRTVVWSTRSSLRRSGHRPDLMLHALPGLLAVEVELQRKSASRMVGIASMYQAWISEGDIAGVLYVLRLRGYETRWPRLRARGGRGDPPRPWAVD